MKRFAIFVCVLALLMVNTIHPSKAGYRDWWTPEFEEALLGLEKGQ